MAHRGFWGGNIVQNTVESTKVAFLVDTDVIELDVARNYDGDYYIFHTGYEKTLLGIDKPFDQITTSELENTYLINSIGLESDYHLNNFEDYLNWFPKDKFINIDRSWEYWGEDKFHQIIADSGLKENVFIKCRIDDETTKALEKLNTFEDKIPFIPIIESQAEYEFIKQFENINLVGAEIIIKHKDSELLDQAFIQKLIDEEQIILGDGEKLGRRASFFLGMEDDYSLLEELYGGWNRMMELGVNIIETDWPNFVSDFRKGLGESDVNRTFGQWWIWR